MKNKLFKHLKIVATHRKYVRQGCFKMGLIWQGLVHDLSKYSITELKVAKYYVGNRSPHEVCREQTGFSKSWISHYTHNKHHWQQYLDITDWPDAVIPVKMPYKYVIEMFCDQVGASKAYLKDKYTKESPWIYWVNKCKGKRLMYKESEYLLEKLIWNLKEADSEKDFYNWYKKNKNYLEELYKKNTLIEADKNL